MTNLRRHLENVRGVYGLTPVVAVNRFPSDTDAEVDLVVRMCSHEGVRAYEATHVRDGGAGAEALARGVVEAVREGKSDLRFVYDDHLSLEKKAEAIATRVYGAARVTFEPRARRRLDQIEAAGYGHLPICMAKTQSSFSTDPSQRGAPSGHTVTVREVRLAAGAGFVVLVTGDIMTMPGLPKVAGGAPHRRRRRRPGRRPQLSAGPQARPSATIGCPSSRRAMTTLSRSSPGATRMTPGTRPTST